ncbi:MAG TPA: F0F1 ATP synthase subunit epsilon [Candidatus Paceibacterota bacterium]
MRVFIHSLEKTLYEGDGQVVVLPARGGEISVMQNHIPLVAPLKQGSILVKEGERGEKKFTVSSGFVEVKPSHVIVLLNP